MNLLRANTVSFVISTMTLPSHFMIFFFGLLALRAAEVSSFGRNAVRGKVFLPFLASFRRFYAFLSLLNLTADVQAKFSSKAVENCVHFVTNVLCRDFVFVFIKNYTVHPSNSQPNLPLLAFLM